MHIHIHPIHMESKLSKQDHVLPCSSCWSEMHRKCGPNLTRAGERQGHLDPVDNISLFSEGPNMGKPCEEAEEKIVIMTTKYEISHIDIIMAYPHKGLQCQALNLYFYNYNLDSNTRAALEWEIAWTRIFTLSTKKLRPSANSPYENLHTNNEYTRWGRAAYSSHTPAARRISKLPLVSSQFTDAGKFETTSTRTSW